MYAYHMRIGKQCWAHGKQHVMYVWIVLMRGRARAHMFAHEIVACDDTTERKKDSSDEPSKIFRWHSFKRRRRLCFKCNWIIIESTAQQWQSENEWNAFAHPVGLNCLRIDRAFDWSVDRAFGKLAKFSHAINQIGIREKSQWTTSMRSN